MSVDKSSRPDRPSVLDIIREITRPGNEVPTDKPEPPPPAESSVVHETERQRAFASLKAFTDHHNGKRHWSIFMMFAIGSLIGFQMIILGLVGAGCWDFKEYQWLLPALLVQNFLQVIGLAQVVVKSLFDSYKE